MENEKVEEKRDSDTEYHARRPRFIAGSLIVILGLILLASTFALGGVVGRHSSEFRTGGYGMMTSQVDNDTGLQLSPGGHMGFHRGPGSEELLGSVSAINGSTITVHNSTADTSVAVLSTTSFYKSNQVSKQSDLKVGDVVSVQGSPNSSGVVQAEVIVIR